MQNKGRAALILRPLDGQDKRRICVNRCRLSSVYHEVHTARLYGDVNQDGYIYIYIDRGKFQDRFPPGNDATRIIYERENRDSARGVVPSKDS